MKDKVKKQLDHLTRNAKTGKFVERSSAHGNSSLHTVIRTQKNADRFMKLLKEKK